MRKRRKNGNTDYRIELYRENTLLAWSFFDIQGENMAQETDVRDDVVIRLACYDLLLRFAAQICPFKSELAWLERRMEEHGRIDPVVYEKTHAKREPGKGLSAGDSPF